MEIQPMIELQIGQRLRAFREEIKIPRTVLARSVGMGSERLASYESGRVPLSFAMFLLLARKYPISPIWLATGKGPMTFPDVSDYIGELGVRFAPRDRFSSVFFEQLQPKLNSDYWMKEFRVRDTLMELLGLRSWLTTVPGIKLSSRFLKRLDAFAREVQREIDLRVKESSPKATKPSTEEGGLKSIGGEGSTRDETRSGQ